MQVVRVGTIKEDAKGHYDIRDWVVADCDLSYITDEELEELIRLAKKAGTYSKET